MIDNSLQKLLILFFVFGLMTLESCTSDDEVDPYQENYIGPGSASQEYLRSDQYKSLAIEIIYEPEAQGDSAAIANLVSFLNERLNKPDGITVSQREIDDQNENSLRQKEITEIEGIYRTRQNNGDTLTTYIYFADSKYSKDSKDLKVLGLAYGATSVIIFEKTIRDNASGDEEMRSKLEESILKHEFGHLLGLVDVGSPAVNAHEDLSHPYHCDNKDCLMYYATEAGDSITNIARSFDGNCLADLKANGGK